MKKTKMLKKNYEFKRVFEKGKHYGGKQIDIYIIKNKKPFNLLGIAVSKKTGKSVYRNKIKRKIKENYRLLEKNIEIGYSFIILWNRKEEKEKACFNIIEKDMKKIFLETNLLKRNIDEENNNKNNKIL